MPCAPPGTCANSSEACLGTQISGKKEAHSDKKKSSEHEQGVPGTTRRDKLGSTGRCPRDFLLFTKERLTEKSIFTPGAPGGVEGGLQKFCVILSSVPLCSLQDKVFGPDTPATSGTNTSGYSPFANSYLPITYLSELISLKVTGAVTDFLLF